MTIIIKENAEVIIDTIKSIDENVKFTLRGASDNNHEIDFPEGSSITKEDIEAKLSDIKTKRATDDSTRNLAKTTAKQKLLDLGLTEEEVKALIGV